MKKFILIAEEGERKLIEQHLPHLLQNDEWQVVVTGVGGINIIQTLLSLPKDAQVLNIGYAGSANYEVGSVKTVHEVRLNHPNVTYPEPTLLLQPVEGYESSVCYSNCDFVLQSDYHDCVFDMELAFIASFGFAKCSALKIVSDNLSLHDYHELTNGVQ